MKVLSVIVKSPEKQKLNFSYSVLFDVKTRVYIKYFVNDGSLLGEDEQEVIETL